MVVKGLKHLSQAVMLGVLGLLSLEKRRLEGYIQWVSGKKLSKQEYPVILTEHILTKISLVSTAQYKFCSKMLLMCIDEM